MTSSAAVCSFNCFSLGKRTTVFLCATLLALSFLLCMGGVAADSHEEAGTITSDTMWVEGDTYNITGMLYVQAGATLTIPQDVTVLFDEYAGIVVNGTLVVAGIDGHPVIFDGNPRPTSGPDGSVSEKVIYPGYWDGIRINGGQTSISFANFRAAAAAVNATGSDGISVLNSTFMDVPYAIVLSSCDDAVVSGNTIVGPDAPAPGTYPVHPYVLRAITLHNCSGAAVSENTITRSGPYAISMDGTGGTLGDITIAGNIIEASDGYGIRIYANSDVGNVIISDNRVGNSTGIGMFIFAYNFGGVTIEGNYVWNGTSGVYLSTSGSFDRIDVIGNEIWNSTGAPVDSYGITIFAPVGLGDVTISGNYIWNNVGNGTVVNGGAFGDVIIEGNIVENNRGNGVIFTGNGFGSVTINGNIVTGNGIGGIKKYTGFYMEGTYCGNISVAGNNISANGWNGLGIWCFGNFSKIEIFGNTASDNGNAGMAFWGYGYGNVTITGNTASRNGNDGIYVGGGEEIAPNTYRNNGFRDVTIAGNVLDGNGGDGIQAGLGNWGSGYCYNGGFGKVTILDNKVRGNHYNGIKVGGNEFDGIIIIKNNIITGNGIGGSFAGLYVEGGTLGDINITGNNFSSNSYDGIGVLAIVLGDVLIDGNTANGNDGCGIAVFTSTGTIGDVILRDNKVRGNADTGICLQANLDIGSITAAHNTVSENDDYGIDFYSTFGRIGDVTLLGNVIEDNGEIGIRVDSGIGLGDVMVRDNVVTGNDEGGIFVLAYNGSIGDVAIEDNALNGNGGAGFRIGGGDIFDLQYETQGIGDIIIRHNTFQNSTGDGVYFEGDVFGNVTVADNKIWDSKGYGVQFAGGTFTNVTVRHNTVENSENHGIWFEGSEFGNVTFRSNTVMNSGDDGIGIWAELSNIWDLTICSNVICSNGGGGIRLGGEDAYLDTIAICENEINGSGDDGIEASGSIFSHSIAIERNIVENSNGDGICIDGSDGYPSNVVIGNNTVLSNHGDGIYVLFIEHLDLYNGEINNNLGWGVYASDVKEAHWFIDLSAMVRNNGVLFSGDVIIDGTMSLKGVEHFLVNYENDNGSITVNEAGTLNVLNSNIGTTAAGLSFGSDSGILEGYLGYYGFDVYGALDLNSVKVGYAVELYLGPTAVASIRSSSVYSNLGHGIMIDGCAPIILDSSFASNGAAGVFITGEGADPLIVGNMFIMNQHGILANDADLGNVIGNIFFMNALDGISVVNTASGNIVGNTFLLNKVEISVDGSTVSITGNRIGYSPSFDMYAIFSAMTLLGYPEHGNVLLYSGSAEMIYDLMTSHVGISMTDSTVTTSGNSYGMLVTAISATGSVLYFGDDILLPSDPNEMVKVPYYSMDNSPIARAAINLWTFGNASLPLAIKNGISAAGSEVHVSGSTIQVLNIAIFLDTSRATITDSSLSASGVGLFLFRASAATVDGSDIGTVQQDATSSVSHLWGVICGIIKDEGGSPIAGATVELSDGRTATTDANGHFEFDEIASGTYTLTVTKDGYKVLSQNLSAAVGEGRDLGTLSLQALGKAGGDTPLGLGILAVVIAAGVLGVALYSRKRQN